jgi:BolA protein
VRVQESITAKITEDLKPLHLEVINESHKHSVPPGSESHFKVVIVSDRFQGKPLVRRHQAVNAILEQELKDDIHALSLETLTGAEWTARGGKTLTSPPCTGGDKGRG